LGGVGVTDIYHDVERSLEALPFVQWDRFTEGTWYDDRHYIVAYGWIDREDDHADYVQLVTWNDGAQWYTTSSAAYTTRIGEILFDDFDSDDHDDCKRVEHYFDVPNAIELTEQATLEEVSDA
jgi:hypothetical protein